MNIQDGIGKGFGSIEISYYMGVNSYFGPRRTNRPHATPNYGPVKSKSEVYYYRQTYFLQKKYLISEKTGKSGSMINVLL